MLHYSCSPGTPFNVDMECLGIRHLIQPESPLSFQVDPMEEVGSEEEKHVPMSLLINWLGWILPRGNTAEGRRRGQGFSCDSLLGLVTQPLPKGAWMRQKAQGIP